VSRAQHALAVERAAEAGVSDRVDIQLRDYRDLRGQFDKIASVEMIEAVGSQYLQRFFSKCAELLVPGGRLALQAITIPDDRYARYRTETDWTQAYIFPGSSIPSLGALAEALTPAGFRIEDQSEIGAHYALTLAAWRERFESRADDVARLGFDDRFRRRWTMYLASSEAMFAEGIIGDAQLLIR
jgi:cyclopropane-fatty-acyl-phospholipid synthase